HALRVLGDDLSAGSTSSNGANSGSLLALPANGVLGLAIADWMNAARAGSNGSDATSRSALTDLNLGNGQIATIALIESLSHAAGVMPASGGPAASTASTGTGNGGGSSAAAPHQPASGAAHIPTTADTSAPTPTTGLGLGLGGFALVAGGMSVLAATARRRRSDSV